LEPIVPDSVAGRVINSVITPRILSGDRDGAVISGMDAMMTVIGGGSLPPAQENRRGREQRPLTLGQLILYGIIGLIILAIFVTHPSLAIYLLFSILSGGRGGGRDDWGGGGGFSGGGGRSGGGGASGSW